MPGFSKASLAAILLLLGAVAAYFHVYGAARNALSDQTEAAERKLAEFERDGSSLVGAEFVSDMHAAVRLGRGSERKLAAALAEQGARLRVPVDREIGGSETERLGRYANAYRWAQDELRRTLLADLEGRSVELAAQIPLREPECIRNRRTPRSADEIAAADRAFQVESLVLRAAAKAGAFPLEAVEISAGWQAASEEELFERTRVLVHLSVEPGMLPRLLRGLLALAPGAPLSLVEAIETAPLPFPGASPVAAKPRIGARIRLIVATYRGGA